MKYALMPILLFLVACSNPDKEFLEAIEHHITENAEGFDMNYNSIDFEVLESITYSEHLAEKEKGYDSALKTLLDAEYWIRGDEFEVGNIFTKEYLTIERYNVLRNWEINHRGTPFEGIDGSTYSNYYEFAKNNQNRSDWLKEYVNKMEEADRLIDKYDSLNEGDLDFLNNILAFYLRIENYHSDRNPDEFWRIAENLVVELNKEKELIKELREKAGDQVYRIVTRNKYEINNPFFGGNKQTLERRFYFDAEMNIVKSEEI